MDTRNAVGHTISYAQQSDADELFALWRVAFPSDSADHVRWFFGERFLSDRALVLREKGRIASCMYLIPYRVKVRGVEHDAPFVVGAATLPQERGRGLMGALLCEAYRLLRERGEALSMLYPFEYGFYRRLGYETVSAQLTYSLSREELRQLTEAKYLSPERAVLRETAADASALKKAYDAMAARFDTAMLRGEAHCFERLDEWTRDHLPALFCAGDGVSSGYALYLWERDALEVAELVYSDAAAMLFLLEWLGERMDRRRVHSIEFPVPVEEPIDFLLRDARGRAQYNPFAMLRPIDVCGLLNSLPLRPAGSFALRVYDAQCPWNDAVFDVEPGKSTHAARSASGRADASCSVNTLAQLAAGFLGGREAAALGLLQGGGNAAEAFERAKCCFFDMY